MSKNDITGDSLTSKATTDAYRDGWDRIFKKDNKMPKICFEIEVDTDTGEVMAGVCPPKEESSMTDMEEDKGYLKPAASVGEALAMAKDAFNRGPSEEDKAMSAMQRGYKGPSMQRGKMGMGAAEGEM